MNDRIVVGVDGSPESVAALRWAAEEAQLRRATLHVLTVWHFPPGAFLPGAVFPPELTDHLTRRAKETQAAAIEATIPDDGTVRVEAEIREGSAPWVLVEAAKDADMLVVGSRGVGRFRERLLGSVSQHCAHHATCPIVIVRRPEGTDQAQR